LLQNDSYSSALVDMYRWLQVIPGSDSLFEAVHSGVSMQMMVPMNDALARRNKEDREAERALLDSAEASAATGVGSEDDSGGEGGVHQGGAVTPVRRERERDQGAARRYGATPTPLRRGMRNMAWPSPRLLRVSDQDARFDSFPRALQAG
jgi:hypothetical protein